MTDSAKVMMSLHDIAQSSKTTEKISKLSAAIAEHGDMLKDILVRTYSPFITYGVKQLPPVEKNGKAVFDKVTYALLDALAKRELTGTAAHAAIAAELARLEPYSDSLLRRVLSADLGAGIANTSINKVCPGLIPVSPYMRCSLASNDDLAEWPWELGVFSQIKADGMFVNLNIHNDVVWLTSRSGQRLPDAAFADLRHEASRAFYHGTQTHGELLVVGPDGADLPRKAGNGIINSVCQGGEWPAGHYPRLSVWDQIDYASAVPKGRVSLHYHVRFSRLVAGLGLANRTRKLQLISLIETRTVRSLAEAYEHCRDALQRGLEGTIIKHPELCWRDTGSGAEHYQVKLKVEARCEVRMVALVEGKKTGKNAELFGSVQCASECGQVEVNIPGFTDKMRKYIFDNWAELQNSVISIIFNDILYSKTKKTHSLFLPRFDELRPDKTVADDKARIEQQFHAAMQVTAKVAPARRVMRSRRPLAK